MIKLYPPERIDIDAALQYAQDISNIDRRLSEWTEAELKCYILANEVRRLRLEIKKNQQEV
jgi:hypothetical protein